MKVIADLHLHSKYSRATSKQLDITNLTKWAKVKGLNLLGTGDFTHPEWIKELQSKLTDDGTGILKSAGGMNWVLQTEVSLIYSQAGKGRRVHMILLAPDIDTVKQITDYFMRKGRVDYDGRPIFKIPCPELTESMKKINEDIELIPAHVWTPWFGLLGSMSGFNSVEEAFQDQTKHIHALETGLSSDPAMNWRLSALDKYSLISNSDSHSFWPWRIGREANIFDIKLTYKDLIKAIRTTEGFTETIEVDPAYGKYHYDGHRNCKVCFSPKESIKLKDICPVCGKPLTIGVEHRVEELADRPEGFKLKGAVPFKKLIPLSDILSKIVGGAVATKKVWAEFNRLVDHFGSSFNVLLDASDEELNKVTSPEITKKIIQNRMGEIKIQPGYDGEYGYPVFSEQDVKELPKVEVKQVQKGLGDFVGKF
ncbi:endonuclease Q family protein [Candidatus Woesearchaeota archaeon]|nr:endonuclease Q family protein [Candidatus Woesearchaeota archaeon]